MASKSWRDTRILICGGGPAGLVTALTLEMCGFANFEILGKFASLYHFNYNLNSNLITTLSEKRTKDKYYRDVGGGYDLRYGTTRYLNCASPQCTVF